MQDIYALLPFPVIYFFLLCDYHAYYTRIIVILHKMGVRFHPVEINIRNTHIFWPNIYKVLTLQFMSTAVEEKITIIRQILVNVLMANFQSQINHAHCVHQILNTTKV